MIAVFLRAGRARVLPAVMAMIALIAIADRELGTDVSLGLLYILPMVAAAMVLRSWQVVALALLCSGLRAWFDVVPSLAEGVLRIVFAFTAYAGAGVFVIAVIRNRAATLDLLANIHREQELRQEAEEQLKIMVESSPAAIVTLDASGIVLAGNSAATRLLLSNGGSLKGRNIGQYLPVLLDALQFDSGQHGLRTAAQCQGRRENGEIFLANTWLSSWMAPEGKRLAAIIVDSSEEMREREEENLRELVRVNQIAAAALSHEVRNLSGAISVVWTNLRDRHSIPQDEDARALSSLTKGLESIASSALSVPGADKLESVRLQEVLDDLRIVIEPQWREIGGQIRWGSPGGETMVIAEPRGLLQVFLNLAQNSHRAVQQCARHELALSVVHSSGRVLIQFRDTGPGVPAPERLFAPFQPGANGSGLGLYVSRAVMRSFGGDLRCEPGTEMGGAGSCFVVELQEVPNAHDD